MSRATAYKWLPRYRTHGQAGLADRSSRPHRCLHALSAAQVRRVLAARRRHRQGPHRWPSSWHASLDRSRVAFSQILPDESAVTAAGFLVEAASFFADHGVRIERVLTDNAKAYTESILFAETAAGLGIARKRTRRYRPQTNARSSGSTRPCWRSGPMAGCTAPVANAAERSAAGCGPTITGDHTPRSTA